MRIFGIWIISDKMLLTQAEVKARQDALIAKGYRLGFLMGQIEARNEQYIKKYQTPMSDTERQAQEILWRKESDEGEL